MLREAATAVQAHSGWAHTAPQTKGPITAEVSLSPLEAGTSKIKAPADWVSGEACFLAHRHGPHVEQGERLVSRVFIRHTLMTAPVVQSVKNLPAVQETQVRSRAQEDPLQKEMATRSSILAWENPMDRGA